MLQLERNQLTTLPPRIIDNNNNSQRRRKTPATLDFQPTPLASALRDLAPIELRQVRRTPEEKLFNALIQQYHYLGYSNRSANISSIWSMPATDCWPASYFLYSKDPLVRTQAKRTLASWDYLFTFLKYEDVDPTNNKAEQALRLAVQSRKICFGSQSNNGMRFTERLSTVIGTCRINSLDPFHFLVKMIGTNFTKNTPLRP